MEMIIDFQQKALPIPFICNHCQAIEMVQQYKYLGANIDVVYMKAIQKNSLLS